MRHWQRLALILLGAVALGFLIRDNVNLLIGMAVIMGLSGAVPAILVGTGVVKRGGSWGHSPCGWLLVGLGCSFWIMTAVVREPFGAAISLMWGGNILFFTGMLLERRAASLARETDARTE